MNAVEIEEAVSNLAAAPFDPETFPFAFLEAFGNKPTTIQKLKKGDSNQSDQGGVLQRNNIHLKVCPAGEVTATLTALRNSPATARYKAKFILATDGLDFEAENLIEGETVACAYSEFADHFGFFLALAGITTVKQIRENAFDIKATGRLNRLYVELLKENPDWDAANRREEMNHFMARLIFCFFAEDTNIFHSEGLFTQTVAKMSAGDASNTHAVLSELFRAMSIPLEQREAAGIRNWANVFPYVNGGLFAGSVEVPRFSKIARSYLLHVGSLDWKKINPDIFGSMIQAVADEAERGALGMHYTSVPNILKVLNPLFLDDLRGQLEAAGDNARKLLNLRQRLAKIRVFDPACGSGNFLVIAYKEMRAIEAEINQRRHEADRHSEIPLTNFRGIEIRHFACEIARLALIIAEYQCDVLYRGPQLALAEFLPLKADNWITCGNALRLDWLSICPPTGTSVKVQREDLDLWGETQDQAAIEFENEGGETYICGNPPYLGSKWQSDKQKADLAEIFDGRLQGWRSLDYVAGWFMKAADFGTQTTTTAAFVATNSLIQGQQVPILWSLILDMGHKITFAHTSFKWSNLANHNAGVTVVIVGISRQYMKSRLLYSISDEERTIVKDVDNINPYLIAGSDVVVYPSSKNLSRLPDMVRGNSPTDGGHLILESHELQTINISQKAKNTFIKRFIGSRELISGSYRYCIWIEDTQLEVAKKEAAIVERIERVRKFREDSKKAATVKAANWSHRFDERKPIPLSPIICIPVISSENRPYLPIGVLPSGTVVSNKAFTMNGSDLWPFSIICSRLNLVWVATVCARMRTDFSYTNTLGWNTFPVPTLTEQNKADLTRCAENILLAREQYFPATIADMYDPDRMNSEFPLVGLAHDRNDEVLERIYIGRRFKNDTERLEKLFELYTKMTSQQAPAKKSTKRKT
ncbi:DNA methyltransferase [Synechococcus sp. PCC 6312]|uniref:class I SAM-dependent DNA methyltransferase n=1 Tax=Synechococcus sp. (strain ATCC 27167 / PCC 6312) TaxID=195253 RepID=UPI00029EE075|nr:DNA methyltransferase [Synechococcus sp. PCC 6312]AFY61200.1 hypothetical protein Syn6312_2075 [Synechococcus sp. PCC 6312]